MTIPLDPDPPLVTVVVADADLVFVIETPEGDDE